MIYKGREYQLLYNAAAYFATQDKFGEKSLIDAINEPGIAGFKALCWALEELSTQSELVRRDMGYDKAEPLSAHDMQINMKISDMFTAKIEILNAVIKGIEQKGNENGEVDLVLAEIQKKRTND